MQRDAAAVAAVFIPSLESLTFLPVLHTHDEDRAFIREVLVRNEVLVAEEDTDGSGNEERTPDALYEWRP